MDQKRFFLKHAVRGTLGAESSKPEEDEDPKSPKIKPVGVTCTHLQRKDGFLRENSWDPGPPDPNDIVSGWLRWAELQGKGDCARS